MVKVAAVIVAGALLLGATPAEAATASPVPGRFCKHADAGTVVTTAKYGKVKCLKRSGRYRWVDIRG